MTYVEAITYAAIIAVLLIDAVLLRRQRRSRGCAVTAERKASR